MNRDQALSALRAREAELRAGGIAALYLFGSTARDEAIAESDIDLLFEIGEAPDFSLLSQAGLQVRLSDVLGRRVDLVARHSLRPRVKRQVEADMVRVF